MLRLAVFSLFLLACSPDQPKPIAPAGKATDTDLSDFFAAFNALAEEKADSAAVADSIAQALADSIAAALADSIALAETIPSVEPFNIELHWEMSYPLPFTQAVEAAVAKWESIIVEGLEDSSAEQLRTIPDRPSSLQSIDDVAIAVRVNERPGADREGSAYGAAIIELYRTTEHYTRDIGIPIYGSIYLPDKPEYREGYQNNEHVQYYADQLNFLAVHEIGHVLGLAYPLLPTDGNGFAKAHSPKALEVWRRHVPQEVHQGRDYVPIHSGHWSFQYPAADFAKMWIITNSTMSIWKLPYEESIGPWPYWDPDSNIYDANTIITELDVAALGDMGYTVDMSQAAPLVVKMKSSASYGFGKANTHTHITHETGWDSR